MGHVSFPAILREGKAMIISELPALRRGTPPTDLRVSLGFLDISSRALADRMNEFAEAKGVILH
jgi:hypothetical protein